MRSFFTFGYGGSTSEEDQLKFDQEMDIKRRKAEEDYIEERDARNKYPGLEER